MNEDVAGARPALRLLTNDASYSSSGLLLSLQDCHPGTSKMISVRECPCAPHVEYLPYSFYCPVQQDYCAVRGDYYSRPHNPVCLDVHNDEIFVRSIWPILLIWFSLTILFCVLTWSGRNAFDFVINCCFPCWNQAIFRAILDNNGRQQTQLDDASQGFWQHLVHRRRTFFQTRYQVIVRRARWHEDGINPESMEFEFCTRKFKAEKKAKEALGDFAEAEAEAEADPLSPANKTHNNNKVEDDADNDTAAGNDTEHDNSCAICFLVLEDGDRVGAIECGHVFHVECLKVWLTRRNVCPLCLHEGIAKPKGQHLLQKRHRRRRTLASAASQQEESSSLADHGAKVQLQRNEEGHYVGGETGNDAGEE